MSDFSAKSCHGYIPYQQVLTPSSNSADYYNLLKNNTRAIKKCAFDFDENASLFKLQINAHFHAAVEFWRGTFYFQALPLEKQRSEIQQIFNEVQSGLNKADILMMSLAGLVGAVAVSGIFILGRGCAGFFFKKLPAIEEVGWIGNSFWIGGPAIVAAGVAVWLTYRELNPALDKVELIGFFK